MRYRLQRHDGTDCSATMVLITVLRMVPIQRYRQFLSLRLLKYLLFVPYGRDDAQYEQSQYEIARQDFQVEGFLPS